MFDQDWTKGASSREYLSAKSFEEWLEKKHKLGEKEFEVFSREEKDFYRDEYERDMDFAEFTSSYRNPSSEALQYDIQESGHRDKKDGGRWAYWFLLFTAVAALFVCFFLYRPAGGGSDNTTSPDTNAEYYYESSGQTEGNIHYESSGQTEDGTPVVDTVRYKKLTPGKKYVITGTLVDRNTKEPVRDKHGNVVESSVTFIPESPDGKVDLPFTIDSSDGEDRVVEIFVEIFLAE